MKKNKLSNKITSLALAATLGIPILSPTKALAGPDAYLGEIMLVGYNFCPRGTTEADGGLLAISSNQALFSLYGTFYGGDGRTTFGLPDLRGRSPIGFGQSPGLSDIRIGEKGGAETHTLTTAQIPSHNHEVNATNTDGDKAGPGGKILAVDLGSLQFSQGAANRKMAPNMIDNTGDGQSFNLRDPYIGLRYCVALVGTFPSRN